jgi:hypothetical protein
MMRETMYSVVSRCYGHVIPSTSVCPAMVLMPNATQRDSLPDGTWTVHSGRRSTGLKRNTYKWTTTMIYSHRHRLGPESGSSHSSDSRGS